MSELLKIVSSQYKNIIGRVDDTLDSRTISGGSMMKNDSFSFQALYRSDNKPKPVNLSATSDLPIGAWRIDTVPVVDPYSSPDCNAYEWDKPGLYPDILMPRPASPDKFIIPTVWNFDINHEDAENLLNASTECYQSVWFTINPDGKDLPAGEYKVKITLTNVSNPPTVLGEETITIEVMDCALPEQTAYYTNWFHVDCLCDMFGVKPYSNGFYRIFDKYVKNMVAHRQNTILLPAFTPPLDTVIGGERMNIQLVDIEKTPDGWVFGFDRMRRFVRHAKRHGIKTFEHSHLFTQWGAKHTPNIYDQSGKRIFGFETDSMKKEYVDFIRSYLVSFMKFASEEKIEKNLIFHISDEPELKHFESYRAAHDTVADLFGGNPVCDAMSDLKYYTEGLVDQPIFHVGHMTNEIKENCNSFWLYYTGGEVNTSNRKISNTAAATRVIGVQMYVYNALGFLQWGYNYYYDMLSLGFSNPASNPSAYKLFPGVAFLCYPIFAKGKATVTPSIREKLMSEGMDDLRALRLLESKIGREATLELCEKHLGKIDTFTIPTGEALRLLREDVNRTIIKNL